MHIYQTFGNRLVVFQPSLEHNLYLCIFLLIILWVYILY
jgi:hypothetical protein